MNVFNRKRNSSADGGFTTAELSVVILVISLMIAVLLPGMLKLISGARLDNVRRDAASIGAAIEILKLDGRFNPEKNELIKQIYEVAGNEFTGQISGLRTDGGFVYSRSDGGETHSVRYDPNTGNVDEVR